MVHQRDLLDGNVKARVTIRNGVLGCSRLWGLQDTAFLVHLPWLLKLSWLGANRCMMHEVESCNCLDNGAHSVWDSTATCRPLNQACSATLSAARLPNATVCMEQNIDLLSHPVIDFVAGNLINFGRNLV